MKKKILAGVLACVLLIGVGVGGTLAWLSDKTSEVKNTFTTSDIEIGLEENTGDEYKMIPGHTIAKDPMVTVKAGSEACWLFVKIDESTNAKFSDYMEYEVADGWTPGDGTNIPANVYYRSVVNEGAAAHDVLTNETVGFDAEKNEYSLFYVLKDNKVSVKSSVTKEMMNSLTDATKPTLTFTAYATQYWQDNETNFAASAAWDNVFDANDNNTPDANETT